MNADSPLASGDDAARAFDVAGYVITSIADDREQARLEARRQIGFYATTLTYDAILDLHGWQAEKEAIRAAWRKFDMKALADAVTDEMLDQIAIAGTADECRAAVRAVRGPARPRAAVPAVGGRAPGACARELPRDRGSVWIRRLGVRRRWGEHPFGCSWLRIVFR